MLGDWAIMRYVLAIMYHACCILFIKLCIMNILFRIMYITFCIIITASFHNMLIQILPFGIVDYSTSLERTYAMHATGETYK